MFECDRKTLDLLKLAVANTSLVSVYSKRRRAMVLVMTRLKPAEFRRCRDLFAEIGARQCRDRARGKRL